MQGALFRLGLATLFAAFPAQVLTPEELAQGADRGLEFSIDRAIDRGVDYLLAAVQGPHGWSPSDNYPSGYAALQVQALNKSGVPCNHPAIQKGIEEMERAKIQGFFQDFSVYSAAVRILAYDAILGQMETDASLRGSVARTKGPAEDDSAKNRYLDRMQKDVDWLLSAKRDRKGAWGYWGPGSQRDELSPSYYDNSNTQFAVLALGVATERRLKVPPKVWMEVLDHFVLEQESRGVQVDEAPEFLEMPPPPPPGTTTFVRKNSPLYVQVYAGENMTVHARGWAYSRIKPEHIGIPYDEDFRSCGTLSMTCGGLSSLLLAQRNLPGSALGGSREIACRRALRDGYGWVTKLFSRGFEPKSSTNLIGDPDLLYSFYSLERVGDLGGIASFGKFRWYEELAKHVVQLQQKDGSWDGSFLDRESAENTGFGKTVEKQLLEDARRSSTAFALLFLGRATDLAVREFLNRKVEPGLAAVSDPTDAPGKTVVRSPPRGRDTWVCLPEAGIRVCLLDLFRAYRRRPSAEILKLVEETRSVLEAEEAGRLVRLLAAAADRSRHEEVRRHAGKLLAAVSGIGRGKLKEYLEWADRWDDLRRIGRE